MNTMTRLSSLGRTGLVAATAAVLSFGAACSRQDRAEARANTSAAVSDATDAMRSTWADARDYTYEKRDDFALSARAMAARLDAQVSELQAEYSEAKADASRRAAMEELRNSHADLRTKLDALGRASADQWESAKRDVISAWDHTEAAYKKARANAS